MSAGKGQPIFVTGCARSGTSMTMGILQACGATIAGKVCGETPWNKKGQFENRGVINNVIKPYLESIGCDPMGQWPLPETSKCTPDLNLRRRIIEQINAQALNSDLDGKPWVLKGAKFCLIWPAMHAAFPEAKWIITQRDPIGIAKSCMKAPFMRAFGKQSDWYKWIDAHDVKFKEMKAARLDVEFVDTPEIAEGLFGSAKAAVKHCGLEWNEAAVGEFVDKSLWHN